MKRRNFIKNFSLGILAKKITDFKNEFPKYSDAIMPVLFVGYGNPMNAIEDNEYNRGWSDMGKCFRHRKLSFVFLLTGKSRKAFI
jgi:4,5-DOPA dioxygenase extradiol